MIFGSHLPSFKITRCLCFVPPVCPCTHAFAIFNATRFASCMRIPFCLHILLIHRVCSFSFAAIFYVLCGVHLFYHHTANLSYCLPHCVLLHRCLFISCNVLHSFANMYAYAYAQHAMPHEVEVKSKRCRQQTPTQCIGWYGCWHKQTSYHRTLCAILTTLNTANAYSRISYGTLAHAWRAHTSTAHTHTHTQSLY